LLEKGVVTVEMIFQLGWRAAGLLRLMARRHVEIIDRPQEGGGKAEGCNSKMHWFGLSAAGNETSGSEQPIKI
jgi:hypothetical protein